MLAGMTYSRVVGAYLKAHAAGLGAALSLFIADLNTGQHVTGGQWLQVIGAYLGVSVVVAAVPNTPTPVEAYPATDTQDSEVGV